MRLLFVTQQVDPDHPALGATVPKIAALARRVDEVVVLADGAVPDVLPANARVRTFGARTKAGRGVRFQTALAAELPGLRGGAVVAHMCPIYTVQAVAATDARLAVPGPIPPPLEGETRGTLGELGDALGIGDRIRLDGPVPR